MDVIAKEYHAARMEAIKAKEMKDKKRQEQAGQIIRKLKKELSDLGKDSLLLRSALTHFLKLKFYNIYFQIKHVGLSDAILTSELGHDHSCENSITSHVPEEQHRATALSDIECNSSTILGAVETTVGINDMQCSSSTDVSDKLDLSSKPVQESISSEGDSEDVELGNMFSEDASPDEVLTPHILELQKKEKLRELLNEKNIDKLDGIWRKVIFASHSLWYLNKLINNFYI